MHNGKHQRITICGRGNSHVIESTQYQYIIFCNSIVQKYNTMSCYQQDSACTLLHQIVPAKYAQPCHSCTLHPIYWIIGMSCPPIHKPVVYSALDPLVKNLHATFHCSTRRNTCTLRHSLFTGNKPANPFDVHPNTTVW